MGTIACTGEASTDVKVTIASDAVLWLDGADASTMFTDIAGTQALPVGGGAVRR